LRIIGKNTSTLRGHNAGLLSGAVGSTYIYSFT